ncbi:hypothetical protein [Campylobacter sp. CCS1377]|uniref:Scaffolding protein n=1 Tax=Campylobacter sp. CCS1377 TaxID=3158229 RepID=A0AAU7E3L4_9BACT
MEERNAINDLMDILTNDEGIQDEGQNDDGVDEGSKDTKNDTKTDDYKAMYESLKKESEAKYKSLEDELKALKNPPKEPSEKELQRESYLKELGLSDINEKLKRLDEFEIKQKQREEQDALMSKYANVESELKKAYPDVDLKALSEIAAKLSGLSEANIDSWKTLITIINKGANAKKADEYMSSTKSEVASDFSKKSKEGNVDNIDLGKELLSLM